MGETNRYFYDNQAHAWVLHQDKDTARIRLTSEQEQHGGESSFFNSNIAFDEDGDNEEEELTVMAIQAAQLARTSLKSPASDYLLENSGEEGCADVGGGSTSLSNSAEPVEEKVVPWLAFLSRRSNMNDMAPSLASVWHLILVAMQTIVPAWLLFPIDSGGLGWHTREVTMVLLMMGGGMALIRAAIAINLTSKSMERDGPKRINTGLLIHAITIIPLCVFSAIMNAK